MKKIFIFVFAAAALAAVTALAVEVAHVQLTRSERESEFPALAWNGSRLGAAWMDGRTGNLEIYSRTVDVNTKQLGSEARLSSSETWDYRPSISWTGSEFGLSWVHDSRVKSDLMFRKLDAQGQPKGGARKIQSQIKMDKDCLICWSGAGFTPGSL